MKKRYVLILVLVMLSVMVTGIFLSLAPEQVPAHYNHLGQIDRWGSKYEYLMFPGIMLLTGLGVTATAATLGKAGRAREQKVCFVVGNGLLLYFNILFGYLQFQALRAGVESGVELVGKISLFLTCGLIVLLGNQMPKVGRNSAFGLRTKWSMANDWCWNQSQRIGAYIMVSSGLISMVVAAFLPVMWAGIAVVAVISVMTAACCYASYRIYLKSQAQ